MLQRHRHFKRMPNDVKLHFHDVFIRRSIHLLSVSRRPHAFANGRWEHQNIYSMKLQTQFTNRCLLLSAPVWYPHGCTTWILGSNCIRTTTCADSAQKKCVWQYPHGCILFHRDAHATEEHFHGTQQYNAKNIVLNW